MRGDFSRSVASLHKLEEDEAKLQLLRDELQTGENSPLVENFDGKKFISGLHSKLMFIGLLFK